jgi:hypothetical protein
MWCGWDPKLPWALFPVVLHFLFLSDAMGLYTQWSYSCSCFLCHAHALSQYFIPYSHFTHHFIFTFQSSFHIHISNIIPWSLFNLFHNHNSFIISYSHFNHPIIISQFPCYIHNLVIISYSQLNHHKTSLKHLFGIKHNKFSVSKILTLVAWFTA